MPILTMQNTVGKLMECFVARKLARDLKDREILSANRGVGVGGVQTRKMQLHLHIYDMYKGFQRKEQSTVAVAINLKDTYNRVQLKLLMNLLIQYGVSLILTQWVAGALLERTGYAAWKLELCSSSAHNGPTTRITALTGPH